MDTTINPPNPLDDTKSIRYSVLLNSKEYKGELRKLGEEIKKSCSKAENEATVSSIFENKIYYFIRSFMGKEIEFQKEVTLGKYVMHIFNNKRMDVITNNLIIEYKHSSKLKHEKDIQDADEQIRDYLTTQKDAGNFFEGILTDGIKVKFFYIKNDAVINGSFIDININSLDRLVKNLLFFDRKKLAGSNIANDFKINSQNIISKRFAINLFNSIKSEKIAEKTNMLFNEWRDLFHLSEADNGKNQDIDKRREALSAIFNCAIESNDLEYKALFCLQTTYAIIVKLTALKLLNQMALEGKDESLDRLVSADSNNVKRFLQQLEDGYIFKNMGIRNLLEGDFFAWYCDDNQWNNQTHNLVKEIVDVLNSYEDLKFTENYEAQDLFKDLYIGMIPKAIRHSLGEYFTPTWLADSVVVNSVSSLNNKQWRGIDPCCGSGIFLLQLINRIINNRDIDLLSNQERKNILHEILHRVQGIDLNPLSVLTARVNYFISISKLIYENDQIEIPIYLGDSANLPETTELDGIICYKYRINTQKKAIYVELPKSFVNDKSFSETMFKLQTFVKAEKPKEIETRILNSVEPTERKNKVVARIKSLSEDLVTLQRNEWDGIWVRIMYNFLSTAKLGKFDLIIGNPPWVKWEFLPQSYAERIKKLCVDKHLFSGDHRTGGISLNICALISNTAATEWLTKDGILAFLMPKTLMTQQSYEGFRNFHINTQMTERIYLQKIDDWSSIGNPFVTASEKFLTYFFGYHHIDYSKGVPVTKYIKNKNVTMKEINLKKDFEAVLPDLASQSGMARQLSGNRTGFTISNVDSKYDFSEIIGECAYKARSGAEFTPGEVYFIKSLEESTSANSHVFKNESLATAKYKVVKKDRMELETQYIYPLVKGPKIEPFHLRQDGDFAIFPYNWGVKDTVEFSELSLKSPKLAEYLIDYKGIIKQQSEKSLELSIGNEFYALSKIGEYTFVENLVAFRDNTRMCATVVTPVMTPWGEKKMPVCAKHAPYISMTKDGRKITLDEAYYISGILNTQIVKDFITSSADSRSVSINLNIYLPEFRKKDKRFRDIVVLSKKAHSAANNGQDLLTMVKKIEILYRSICQNRSS